MPKNAADTADQSKNRLEELAAEAIKGIMPYPVVISGVSRKVNIGNFENIDVYSGIVMPIMALPWQDEFLEAVEVASKEGFAITSRETGDRYDHIKGSQGR